MIRTWKRIETVLPALLFAPAVFGQASVPQGPTLGVAFDSASGELRRIVGLPGAAHFSAPLLTGGRFSSLVLSPQQDFGLGIRARDSQLYVVHLIGSTAPVPVSGMTWNPSRMVLSPSGQAAVLFGPSNSIRWLTGLPDSPTLSDEVDLSAMGEALQASAISDDGLVVAAFGSTGTPSQLYAIRAGSGPQLIGTAHRTTAIGFLPGSTAVLVADAAARQILIFRLSDSGASRNVVATEADGIIDPVALGASGSGRWAIAANASDQKVIRIDLTGAAPASSFVCPCQPSEITRLAGDAVFQLGGLSDQPLWIFDGDDANPRIVFVPAPVERRVPRGSR